MNETTDVIDEDGTPDTPESEMPIDGSEAEKKQKAGGYREPNYPFKVIRDVT